MRIYTFRCTSCRHVFDVDMLLSDYLAFIDTESLLMRCPSCGLSMKPTRIMVNTPAVIYNVGGFYVTDSRRSNELTS